MLHTRYVEKLCTAFFPGLVVVSIRTNLLFRKFLKGIQSDMCRLLLSHVLLCGACVKRIQQHMCDAVILMLSHIVWHHHTICTYYVHIIIKNAAQKVRKTLSTLKKKKIQFHSFCTKHFLKPHYYWFEHIYLKYHEINVLI